MSAAAGGREEAYSEVPQPLFPLRYATPAPVGPFRVTRVASYYAPLAKAAAAASRRQFWKPANLLIVPHNVRPVLLNAL